MNTKLCVQRIGIVPHDVETAASPGTSWPEGADDDVAAGLDRVGDLANVGDSLIHGCQKMKYGTVVPHVVRRWCQLRAGDIGHEPTDSAGESPYTLLADVDSGLGNIENGEVAVAA